MVGTRGSVHHAGLLLDVFVRIMALVPLIRWDHSVDADIGLGHPVLHLRLFRWWILFGGCLGSITMECCPVAILLGDSVY
jgi:hypothetical protein